MPAIGGAGSSGGALITMFAWCWNSAERRLMVSSTRFVCPYPASSRFDYPVSVSSRWASLKLVLSAIHVFWIRGRQFQDLMDSRKFSVLLRILEALEISWGCNRDSFPYPHTQEGLQYCWKCCWLESRIHSAYLLLIFQDFSNDLVRFFRTFKGGTRQSNVCFRWIFP